MDCPKCNGPIKVKDCVNVSHNEIFRKKECLNCGHIFYTVEFEVEDTRKFQKEWHYYHRHKFEESEKRCEHYGTKKVYEKEWPIPGSKISSSTEKTVGLCFYFDDDPTLCNCKGNKDKCALKRKK